MTVIIRAILSKGNTELPCVLLTETSPVSMCHLFPLAVLNFFSVKINKSIKEITIGQEVWTIFAAGDKDQVLN